MYYAQHLSKSLLAFMLFLMASPPAMDQSLAQEKKRPRLSVDLAQFLGDSTHTKLEVYQGIDRSGLVYQKANQVFVARFRLETKVMYDDSVVIQQEILESDTIDNKNLIGRGQQFVFTTPFLLEPGSYRVLTFLHDQNSEGEAQSRISVEISLFPKDSLAMSDIQFASKIQRASDPENPLVKNNLLIMPNPQALFGDGFENITFYAELYNLDVSANQEGAYHVDYVIEDREGKTLSRLRGKRRRKMNQNTAIYTSFDISGLKIERYLMRLEAFDDDKNIRASASKHFSVFRRAEALAFHAEQERKVYQELDEAALQNYFDQISYIAAHDEKSIFRQLTMTGKREFLVQFWERRDPTKGTSRNEFKEDYIERLVKAKINFSFGETEGWRTDRGRILLLYAAPDFIDRLPGLSDRNANETWYYETLQGGCLFIFIDLNDNGRYRLIHSTHRDEVDNPDWESYLYK